MAGRGQKLTPAQIDVVQISHRARAEKRKLINAETDKAARRKLLDEWHAIPSQEDLAVQFECDKTTIQRIVAEMSQAA